MSKINILLTNLSYINHNYGAQGIAFPFIHKLNKYINADFTFAIPARYYEDEKIFIKKCGYKILLSPPTPILLSKNKFFYFYNFYRGLKKKRIITKKEKEQFNNFFKEFNNYDVIIDLAGIEFIGNVSFKKKFKDYLSWISMQLLSEKYHRLYLKYTKSYGPFPDSDKIYKLIIKKNLSKLPFLLVRGENNLEEVKKLGLNIPVYSFPDISLLLEPESKEWALGYFKNIGIDTSKSIVGISPSSVIASIRLNKNNSSCGDNHIKLCKRIIYFYRENNQQVVLLPHSIADGKDINSCDLALAKKIYSGLKNKRGVFLVDDTALTYKQTRALIGLMDFYLTGRYHSVSSAPYMAVPVVSLSWHVKYEDIMSLFFEGPPVINCRKKSVEESFSIIKKYYFNRSWFNREKILGEREKVLKKIDRSIYLLVRQIEKYYEQKMIGSKRGKR